MLNFDSNHEYVKENLKNTGRKIAATVVLAGLIIANVMLFSGCAKTVDCDINETHAHYYTNEDNMGRYIVSEKVSVSGLDRQDSFVYVNNEDKDLLKFINEQQLFKISDNQETIANITANHKDFKEYRYKYYYYNTILVPYKVGNITNFNHIMMPCMGHSWTSNPTHHNLTGEVRDSHYVYYGFKIIKNDKGEYDVLKSTAVDRLEDLPVGYDYIKADFYDIVNLHNKNEVFGYEDGPMEGKEIMSEEEYYQAEVESNGKSR